MSYVIPAFFGKYLFSDGKMGMMGCPNIYFALATGGHCGLLACGGPSVAERAPLGKAGLITKEQQGFALARVL
jgi:hypothetical protein